MARDISFNSSVVDRGRRPQIGHGAPPTLARIDLLDATCAERQQPAANTTAIYFFIQVLLSMMEKQAFYPHNA